MSLESKVVWSEGMFLNPQHFQQQERYFERYINGRCGPLSAYSWGFQEFELDTQLLKLGKISLLRGRGIFPDGTPFSFPDIDEPPPVIELPEGVHNTLIYLAIPVRRLGAVDVLPEGHTQGVARYSAAEESVRDITVEGGDSENLSIGKLRLCLLKQTDDLSGYAYISAFKIAETRQDKDILLDESFIPTVLDCKATPNLAGFIAELAGMLRHRGEAIAGRLADVRRGGTAEIADYMLLQLVNRAEPLVNHLAQVNCLHPLDLFIELVQLTGEISTFVAKGKRPPELPMYLHDDMPSTFEPVFAALRQALSQVYEQTAISIGLEEKGYGIRVADKYDKTLITSATFVLVVRADVADDVIRKRFPSQIKIGPVEGIRQLVNAALPGILCRPLPVAPRQIPFRSGYTYFELEQHSELWKKMPNSGGFAFHVAGEFPGLEMEFWAIRR